MYLQQPLFLDFSMMYKSRSYISLPILICSILDANHPTRVAIPDTSDTNTQ